jgi:hypothetical protein
MIRFILSVLSFSFARPSRPLDPRATTPEFQAFARDNASRVQAVFAKTGTYPAPRPGGYNGLLVEYIRRTGNSPFVGGEPECHQFLLEQGIV